MEVIITEREELKVVGMVIKTKVEDSKIPELWEEFIGRMNELEEVAVPDCSLGICLYEGEDYKEGEEFSYMVALVVKDDSIIPAGMVYREIPKTKVAVFTHTGPIEELGETYNYIYEEWFPQSAYALAEADEIEWYDSRFKFDEQDSKMDIHIPIKDADHLSDEDIDEFFKNL
ncbi:MAG: AraC family transcriptional regulator [Candidatus Cloacimonetes bacterium]|nr:AraC family transcriptional regulator [Candidatus Cloacimonadota bacterium]